MLNIDSTGPLIKADFNGLFGDLLCLSHESFGTAENGTAVELQDGMIVTAYEQDEDFNGNPDRLIATGQVVASPDWLSCKGSVWSLQIDSNGVRHESEI